jgi:hypothetical protein
MDDFIVARPKAKIFKTLMGEIANITKEGIWPYPKYNVTAVNPKTEAVAFPNIVEALLNVYD